MEFNENPNKKVYSIDVDGTLTNGEPFWKQEPTPNFDVVTGVRELYKAGNIIIIHTARQWECALETVSWLIKHGVPYHGIFMNKGGSDVYVDDKSFLMEKLPIGANLIRAAELSNQ